MKKKLLLVPLLLGLVVFGDSHPGLAGSSDVVTMTKTDPGPNFDSYRFGGNVRASASASLSGGVSNCYSSAHASVTSFDSTGRRSTRRRRS